MSIIKTKSRGVDFLMIDQWRLNNDWTTNDAVISANWERPDDASYGRVGTGMTESSGIFTFPTTGLYLITANVRIAIDGPDAVSGFEIKVSTDGGSTGDVVAAAFEGNDNNTGSVVVHTSATATALVDVTNASTFQVSLMASSIETSNAAIKGNTNENHTMITFERIS